MSCFIYLFFDICICIMYISLIGEAGLAFLLCARFSFPSLLQKRKLSPTLIAFTKYIRIWMIYLNQDLNCWAPHECMILP